MKRGMIEIKKENVYWIVGFIVAVVFGGIVYSSESVIAVIAFGIGAVFTAELFFLSVIEHERNTKKKFNWVLSIIILSVTGICIVAFFTLVISLVVHIGNLIRMVAMDNQVFHSPLWIAVGANVVYFFFKFNQKMVVEKLGRKKI